MSTKSGYRTDSYTSLVGDGLKRLQGRWGGDKSFLAEPVPNRGHGNEAYTVPSKMDPLTTKANNFAQTKAQAVAAQARDARARGYAAARVMAARNFLLNDAGVAIDDPYGLQLNDAAKAQLIVRNGVIGGVGTAKVLQAPFSKGVRIPFSERVTVAPARAGGAAGQSVGQALQALARASLGDSADYVNFAAPEIANSCYTIGVPYNLIQRNLGAPDPTRWGNIPGAEKSLAQQAQEAGAIQNFNAGGNEGYIGQVIMPYTAPGTAGVSVNTPMAFTLKGSPPAVAARTSGIPMRVWNPQTAGFENRYVLVDFGEIAVNVPKAYRSKAANAKKRGESKDVIPMCGKRCREILNDLLTSGGASQKIEGDDTVYLFLVSLFHCGFPLVAQGRGRQACDYPAHVDLTHMKSVGSLAVSIRAAGIMHNPNNYMYDEGNGAQDLGGLTRIQLSRVLRKFVNNPAEVTFTLKKEKKNPYSRRGQHYWDGKIVAATEEGYTNWTPGMEQRGIFMPNAGGDWEASAGGNSRVLVAGRRGVSSKGLMQISSANADALAASVGASHADLEAQRANYALSAMSISARQNVAAKTAGQTVLKRLMAVANQAEIEAANQGADPNTRIKLAYTFNPNTLEMVKSQGGAVDLRTVRALAQAARDNDTIQAVHGANIQLSRTAQRLNPRAGNVVATFQAFQRAVMDKARQGVLNTATQLSGQQQGAVGAYLATLSGGVVPAEVQAQLARGTAAAALPIGPYAARGALAQAQLQQLLQQQQQQQGVAAYAPPPPAAAFAPPPPADVEFNDAMPFVGDGDDEEEEVR